MFKHTLMLYRHFILLIILTWGLSLSAQGQSVFADAPKPIALGIYVIDRYAILREEVELHRDLFKTLFPNIEYRPVYVDVSSIRMGINTDYARSSVVGGLVEQIQKAVQRGDVVSHLFFSDHGSYDRKGSGVSSMEHLGYFSAQSLSSDLLNILNPLKKHFAKDALIFFESCSLVSPIAKDATASIKNLVTKLGIPNARVWVSMTPYVGDYNLMLENSSASYQYLRLEGMGHINWGYEMRFKNFNVSSIVESNSREKRIGLIRDSGRMLPPACVRYFF